MSPLTSAEPKNFQNLNETGGAVLCLNSMKIKLRSSWGLNKIGLTGLQVLGETGEPIFITNFETEPDLFGKDIKRYCLIFFINISLHFLKTHLQL